MWVPCAKAPLYRACAMWSLDRPRVRGRACQAWGSCATSWRPRVFAAASPSLPAPRGSFRSSPPAPPDPGSAVSVCVSPARRPCRGRLSVGGVGWEGPPAASGGQGAEWCPPPEGPVVSQAATGTGSGLAVFSSRWWSGPSMGTVQVVAKPAFTPTSTHGAPVSYRRKAFGASAQVAASPRPPQVREAGSPGPFLHGQSPEMESPAPWGRDMADLGRGSPDGGRWEASRSMWLWADFALFP